MYYMRDCLWTNLCMWSVRKDDWETKIGICTQQQLLQMDKSPINGWTNKLRHAHTPVEDWCWRIWFVLTLSMNRPQTRTFLWIIYTFVVQQSVKRMQRMGEKEWKKIIFRWARKKNSSIAMRYITVKEKPFIWYRIFTHIVLLLYIKYRNGLILQPL
jgi:hypothetical protein